MFPPGFLGTRADVLIDIVMLSFAVILPALIVSWRRARQGSYTDHRNIQLTLFITLTVVVAIFEYDLSTSGGIFALTRGSAYEGTTVLAVSVYIHTAFSIVTSLVWIALVIISLVKFGNPPRPSTFSPIHRFWGRLGMVTMIMTGLTAFPLYYFGFVA